MEREQLGLKLVPIWSAGVVVSGLTLRKSEIGWYILPFHIRYDVIAVLRAALVLMLV